MPPTSIWRPSIFTGSAIERMDGAADRHRFADQFVRIHHAAVQNDGLEGNAPGGEPKQDSPIVALDPGLHHPAHFSILVLLADGFQIGRR
ncbi:MAG: hypothetical protein WDO73_26980 [Ignavibacteriota bacterium]